MSARQERCNTQLTNLFRGLENDGMLSMSKSEGIFNSGDSLEEISPPPSPRPEKKKKSSPVDLEKKVPKAKKPKFTPKPLKLVLDEELENSVDPGDLMSLAEVSKLEQEIDPFAAQEEVVKLLPPEVAAKFNVKCHNNLWHISQGKPTGDEWYYSVSLKCHYRVPCFRCGEFLTTTRIKELVAARGPLTALESRGVKLRVFSSCPKCESVLTNYIEQDPQFYNGSAETAVYAMAMKSKHGF